MPEHLCVHCGAILPTTGTFCLACDTPVAGERSALSVSETEIIRRGRPLVVIGVATGGLLVVGLIVWAASGFWSRHVDGNASAAAVHGVQVILRAEAGHPGACPYAGAAIAGPTARSTTECNAVVGADPGVTVRRLHATQTDRHGDQAVVELRGTWVDKAGRHRFEDKVAVTRAKDSWLLVWDGKALTSS